MEARRMTFDITAKSLGEVFRSYGSEDSSIRVGNETIRVSKELSILVSNSIYLHLNEFPGEFRIDLSEMAGIPDVSVADCLRKLFSLAEGSEFATFSEDEIITLRFLSKILKNLGLRRIINEFSQSDVSNQLKWSSRLLSDFSNLPKFGWFCFKIGDELFECPRLLAQLISSEASRRLLADSTLCQFNLTIPDGFNQDEFGDAFSQIFDLLSGRSLEISMEKRGLFEAIAAQIGFRELLESLRLFDRTDQPIDISNVYEKMTSLPIDFCPPQFSEIIEFAASNFYQLNIENLLSIPIPIIEKVIHSPNLKLQNEAQLLRFVESAIERSRDAIPMLAEVQYEYLDSNLIKQSNGLRSIECLTTDTWDAICKRLVCEDEAECAESFRWIKQPIYESGKSIREIETQILKLQACITETKAENASLCNNIQMIEQKCEEQKGIYIDLQKKQEEAVRKMDPNSSAGQMIQSLLEGNSFQRANHTMTVSEISNLNNSIQNSEAEVQSTASEIARKITVFQKEAVENAAISKELNEWKMHLNVPKLMEFPLIEENRGVFDFFFKMKGNKNPSMKGLINVTSSSNADDSRRAENAVVWGPESIWSSVSEMNEWIQVDFRQNFFALMNITIQAHPAYIPGAFTIMASDDGSSFLELKKLKHSRTGKQIATFRFNIESLDPHRVFRVVQNESCDEFKAFGRERCCFAINSIEFFGTLICPSNSNLI